MWTTRPLRWPGGPSGGLYWSSLGSVFIRLPAQSCEAGSPSFSSSSLVLSSARLGRGELMGEASLQMGAGPHGFCPGSLWGAPSHLSLAHKSRFPVKIAVFWTEIMWVVGTRASRCGDIR